MTPLAATVVLLAWCAVAAGFTAGTLLSCARLMRAVAGRPAPSRWPSLLVLRPCEGEEPGLEGNLGSSLAAYPGPRRVLLLVPSESDPSHAIATRVRDAAPQGSVEVLVTRPAGAANRKSAQLSAGLDHALASGERPEVVVQADSDVRLDDLSLPSLVAALGDDERVAAAFASPIEPDGHSPGDAAAAALLSASHHDFLAIAALARLSGGVVSLAGALAAHRTGPLVDAGGFRNLEDVLGEDFEMGRRLAARGLRVEISRATVTGAAEGRSLREILVRTARWMMVVRRQRGAMLFASYPLLLAPTPLLLVVGAVLALLGAPVALLAALGLLVLRAVLAARLRRFHGEPVGPLRAVLLPLAAELLLLAAFPRALTSDEVVWRGRRLRIERGGRIVPLEGR